MKSDRQKKAAPDKKMHDRNKTVAEADGQADQESCRCKEVSRKSLAGLLKVAISDLSFWKKGK